MELDIEYDFNPIFMDINDFQYIMPPQVVLPPFDNKSLAYIMFNAAYGVLLDQL